MRKPKIRIVRSGLKTKPWIFLVKWPGRGFKNKDFFTFAEALHAVGCKGVIE